jgi:drug/metabolite transporter (DMT)-like permease
MDGGEALNGLYPQGKLQPNERYLAWLLMILTVLFWGFSFISTKIVLTDIPPVSIAFFRQFIAISALIPLAWFTGTLSRVNLRDFGIMACAGLFGTVLYFTFENTGLQYTTASNASMIVACLPAFTIISEALLFKLKVNWKMIACIAFSITGIYLVVAIYGRLDFSSAQFLGNLLMLGSMISWVIYTILNKYVDKQHSSITIATYQAAASIFLFIPFVIPEIGRWPYLTSLSPDVVINLAFLGVFCSAVAYFFYIYAAKRLGATISAAMLNLIPVVTVISGHFLLQESLVWIQIMGMAITMFSIYLLSRLMRQPP